MPQKTKHTPMMEQYFNIKKEYEDCFLFYRLGDFYELFYDDALKAAKILEITLTSRNKNAEDPIPMCGVPHHAAKEYIRTLVELGYKVALCEQVEDPKLTKGMVKREVVQVLTPGTYIDYSNQQEGQNHYLAAVQKKKQHFYLAYVDISTGELLGTTLVNRSALHNELSSLHVKELVIEDSSILEEIESLIHYFQYTISYAVAEPQYTELVEKIPNEALKHTFYMLFDYLSKTQKRSFFHLKEAVFYQSDQFLKMGHETKRNLELIQSIRSQKKHGSLFWFLDETKTAMGARLLKQWIEKPLLVKEEIEERFHRIDGLMNAYFERVDIEELLKKVYDLERIVGRVSFGSANARDLLRLKQTLEVIPTLRALIQSVQGDSSVWEALLEKLDPIEELSSLIQSAIHPEAPFTITEGDIIRDGYSSLLDQYRSAMKNGKQWVAQLQQDERERTGIKTLKVGFNKVFGYYIEITKANLAHLDTTRYERKQTLANAERFVTSELKEKERLILEAEEKSTQLEYELFVEVRNQVKIYSKRLQLLAYAVASIDVLRSLAVVSEQYQFVRPMISMEDRQLYIENGRHPVVEKVLGRSAYVPNSIRMEEEDHILLITGPNMSGKSTYMRQLALIVILAQMGCFVPATYAKIPLFTQIFTRIGAADDLISGESTFMVEMIETNTALQESDAWSMILFDEIGRGTATYDGMALAEAIIRYIHERIPAKILFSTHYHELTDLSKELFGLKNVHVGATEKNGELVFLHKIMEGPADKSYGIHVAKLAGLPGSLLQEAQKILKTLEAQHMAHAPHPMPVETGTLNEVEKHRFILDELDALSLEDMTPIEVMVAVAKWKKELQE